MHSGTLYQPSCWMHSGTLYQPSCWMHSGTLYQYGYKTGLFLLPVTLLTTLAQSQKVRDSFIQEVKAAEAWAWLITVI